MYSDFAKSNFEEYRGSDYDYLLIAKYRDNGHEGFDHVPHIPIWETVDQAIRWFLENGWDIVEVYDLYAEWHKSMIRSVKKTKEF